MAGSRDHRDQRPADEAVRSRYEQYGYDGLFDRRRGKPSPRRVPLGTVEKVLGLYQEKYFDFNVRHFHEKLREEHGLRLSYTWVKLALQGAGLVNRRRKRGLHRQRRPRRPLPGMLLHLDGSQHRWFSMIAGMTCWFLDDASSENYAQLVEQESTRTGGGRAAGEPFIATGPVILPDPEGGQPVDRQRLTQVPRPAGPFR